jgi:4-diphosphocytidyl-2-C-methyl-D-erythritol kinase
MTREKSGGDSGDDSGAGGGAGGGAPSAGLHVVRFAPAKLNLTLAVLGRRDDGYHSLHSVMVRLLLGDALTVSVAPPGTVGDLLRVSGLEVSAAEDNLVLRAIAAVRAAVAAEDPRSRADLPCLSARLVKRIPVAAGLGGGSSDAAAAIEAALAAWHTTLSTASRTAVAASLGSDVPFFLAQGAAVISGRGEFVESLPAMATEPPAVLLVTPGLPVSSPVVFGAYAAGARPANPTRARATSEDLAAMFRAGITAEELLGEAQSLAAANDLLPGAISVAPGLEEFIRKLESVVGRPVCQSGSGPTQWVLYPTLAEARKAVRLVRLAIGRGSLPILGDGETFVAATDIAGPFLPPQVTSAGPSDGRRGIPTDRANRPHSVHNGINADVHPGGGSADQPHTPKGDDSR